MRLRSHLIVLGIVVLVPVVTLAAVTTALLARSERRSIEQSLIDKARLLAFAVDHELNTTITALTSLAASDELHEGQLASFYGEAERARAAQPAWSTIAVVDESGATVLDLQVPFGTQPPETTDRAIVREVIGTGRPVISGLVKDRTDAWQVIVAVRAVTATGMRYVVRCTVRASTLASVVARHQPPAGGVLTVVDRDYRIVARTQQAEEFVGRTATAGLSKAIARRAEGVIRGENAAGMQTYGGYSVVPAAAWTAVVGVPADVIETPLRRSLATVAIGAAISLVLALAGGILLNRRIARPISALSDAAAGVGRGEPVHTVPAGVTEIATVGRALNDASRLLQERAAEREALLFAERRARAESDALGSVTAAMNASLDVPRVLQQVAEAARELTASDVVRIALAEPGTGAFVYRYLSGTRAGDYDRVRLVPGRGFVGRVLATRQPYRTEDAGSDPAVDPEQGRPLIEAEGVKAAMVLPIVADAQLLGIVYVARRSSRPFTDEDEAIAARLAGHAAAALRNAELYERERAAREDAERANRAKDEFLAMLGHELRNPLAAVLGALTVLNHAGRTADAAAHARGVIDRQSRHLANLVDDLLDVARVTTGKIVLQPRTLDLAEAARRALAAVGATQRSAHVTVTTDLAPVWVHADPTRVEQILTNVIGNALKFTPAGGSIHVATRIDDDRAALEVRDSGVGIAPELMPRIFDLFVQGAPSLDRPLGGLGLGLTLASRLAALHGGGLTAASPGLGQGSTFTLRLPRMEAPAVGARTPEPVRLDAGRSVVLVEDNADLREMMRMHLELDGHTVIEAVDGRTGVEAILAQRPDVALIDIGLPEIDGYEVARSVRARQNPPVTYLVALTGYGQTDDKRRAREAGFDAHLIKPVTPEDLEAAIAAADGRAARQP